MNRDVYFYECFVQTAERLLIELGQDLQSFEANALSATIPDVLKLMRNRLLSKLMCYRSHFLKF